MRQKSTSIRSIAFLEPTPIARRHPHLPQSRMMRQLRHELSNRANPLPTPAKKIGLDRRKPPVSPTRRRIEGYGSHSTAAGDFRKIGATLLELPWMARVLWASVPGARWRTFSSGTGHGDDHLRVFGRHLWSPSRPSDLLPRPAPLYLRPLPTEDEARSTGTGCSGAVSHTDTRAQRHCPRSASVRCARCLGVSAGDEAVDSASETGDYLAEVRTDRKTDPSEGPSRYPVGIVTHASLCHGVVHTVAGAPSPPRYQSTSGAGSY